MASKTDVVKNYTITYLYYVSISVSACLSLCNHQSYIFILPKFVDDDACDSFHGKSSRALGPLQKNSQ